MDVRVIAATNRNLEEAIKEGESREDLFNRLNVVTLELPPLRARGDDVLLLARHFVERFARDYKKPVAVIAEEAIVKLKKHSWPGNVRELRNVVERAVLLARGSALGAADFVLGSVTGEGAVAGTIDSFDLPEEGFDLK